MCSPPIARIVQRLWNNNIQKLLSQNLKNITVNIPFFRKKGNIFSKNIKILGAMHNFR